MNLKSASILVLLALGNACVRATPVAMGQHEAATHPGGAKVSSSQKAAAFAQADRRARAVIEQIRCAQRVAGLRQRLVFGPLNSLGGRGQCTIVNGRYVGVFYDADTLFSGAARLSAVDLASSTRRLEPIDTIAILAVGRATRAAQLRGMGAYQRLGRQYTPVAFRFDAGSIEIWLVPSAVLTGPPLTVGGERGYVFTPDGRVLVREIDAFDAMRALAFPDTGVVRVPSAEDAVPSMSEMVVANLLHDSGRRVAIDMRSDISMLVGEGSDAVWVHIPRKE